ncbi:MAG: TRAM domain-containing protein, partial [Acidobacteriaceae bacterium]|nr:TRAM domain-containing protein [Acidobacteriaceae bacterium]
AAMRPFSLGVPAGTACGLIAGACAIALEAALGRASVSLLAGSWAGMFIGALSGVLLAAASTQGGLLHPSTASFLRVAAPLAGAYVGLLVGAAKSGLIDVTALGLLSADKNRSRLEKILDTSVLIDGRISDIAESGFLDGTLVIPQFVLHELQLVADSPESAKRNRGRRGLDLVQRLQKIPGILVEVAADDFPAVREVDLKLIEMAKLRQAKIVTNDFNLNKLAQVQGVDVLNINELANALRPVVLPGETMRVFILKEGKEYNQGVAYLDDGTMVVVDNAKRLISKTVDITVTSVLQTTAGKMIFGRYDERSQSGGEHRGTSSGAVSAAATSAGSS